MTTHVKMATRVNLAEVTPPVQDLALVDAVYRTALIPVGEMVEVVIKSGGKILATDSWMASAQIERNAALQVRYRVFDDCTLSKIPVPVEEPI